MWTSVIAGLGVPKRDRATGRSFAYVPDSLVGRTWSLDGEAAEGSSAAALAIASLSRGFSCAPRPSRRRTSRVCESLPSGSYERTWDRTEGSFEDLCGFCNDDSLPAVAQAAVAHATFETIHPFADGNGRTGRALIYMVLLRRGLSLRSTPPISLV